MVDFCKERPLSKRRAAEFLDVSTRTIERMWKDGLEKRWIGRRPYTTRAAIQRFSRPDERRTPESSQRTADAQERDSDAYLEEIGVG